MTRAPVVTSSAASPATLFFACSGAPPALHSFPTRRSSDLGERQGDDGDGESRQRVGAQIVKAITLAKGDRKSTRLNSSHLGISYAVFCLKKKTTSQSTGW